MSLAGTDSDLQRIISPECMPNLVNLACDAAISGFPLEAVIINILPQLKTLRITDERNELLDNTLRTVLTQATNLIHLAPDCCNTEFYGIFDDTVKLDLESLHLSKDHSQFADFVLPLLIMAVKGEHKMLKFKRVVLYGSKEKWKSDLPDLHLGVLEWRENEDKPAFDNFDRE